MNIKPVVVIGIDRLSQFPRHRTCHGNDAGQADCGHEWHDVDAGGLHRIKNA